MLKNILIIVFTLAISFSAKAGDPDSLYYICDGGNELWRINKATGLTTHIGDIGVSNVETMAYWDDVIYAADNGDFGTVNKTTGVFTSIGDIDGAGAANGADGAIALDDIDGMSFDPWTGELWASHRRDVDFDVLFKINPSTGQYIPNAFGTNIDYIIIGGSGVYQDIDDIAVSPVDGKMYTIHTTGGSAQILEINKYFGVVTEIAIVDRVDVEGLGYHNSGTFWGTSGSGNTFFEINVNTGATSNVTDIEADSPDCSDPEAVSALVADLNLVSGKVWDDADFDQAIGAEGGIAGVTVYLYYDADGDGLLGTGDVNIQSAVTDVNGDYSFDFATTAKLIIVIDESTLPANYAMTTDNIETVNFTDNVNFGETDANNNFGAATDTDCDGDGIPDFYEGTGDSDSDGIQDQCDLDSDNDGILDSDEGTKDSDGDGIKDYLDLDSDNDGIADAIEANDGVVPAGYDASVWRIVGSDTDSDGLLNDVDNDPTTQYGPGSTSPLPANDTDGDSYPDYADLDSDGDGITDIIEAGGVDANFNGQTDNFSDVNGDGIDDTYFLSPLTVTNTDGTGNPDYLDLDSDGDGIDDRTEGFSTAGYPNPNNTDDCDFDGLIDWFDVAKGGLPAPPVDTDNDGIPDFQDLDSDGDGNPDLIEGHDTDGDGTAETTPSGSDTDGDGIDNAFDTDDATFGTDQSAALPNQDADSEPDFRDKDDLINPGIFYFVCDGSDELYSVNPSSGATNFIGAIGVGDVEAIAYWNGVLYGVDGGDFGTLNLSTGVFTSVENIDVDGIGNGADGAQEFDNIDGLSFDPWTGILWASQRRSGEFDLLFQIDHITGKYIKNAFGAGLDYVVVDGVGVFNDVDDIAISPTNGVMYTVGNDGSQDQLLQINKYTGAVDVVVASLSEQDVEGMGYYNDGSFWGTVGSDPGEFWNINPDTGIMNDEVALPCGDPEALAALVAPPNTVSGTVWEDTDFDQTINGTEVGLTGVTVNLYYDTDCDGVLDAGEPLLQTAITDGSGDYSFLFATTSCLVLQIDESTLPAGYALTTDNLETAIFIDNVNFNETDANNNFGAASDTDCDNDGIPDFAEGGIGVDTDGDGVDNMCDLDSDNDGILDSEEGLTDTDLDGIADYIDWDSDNDGIPDALEANNGEAIAEYSAGNGNLSGTDSDGDGLIDAVDADLAVPYGGGSESVFANADHDGDGIVDSKDLDSDNDCIVDAIEGGGNDANGDGIQDGHTDGNGDGLSDLMNTNPLSIPDSDIAGNPDYIDLDSDGDGLSDALEGNATGAYSLPTTLTDADGDGLYDVCDTDFGGTPISPVDTDGDGTPDFQDLDSDNDGITDIIEGNDANADGVQDYIASGSDTDGDGIDDSFDQDCGGAGVYNVISTDYAEEDTDNGAINLTSGDAELIFEDEDQEVGFYFPNVLIDNGVTVNSAYIQFEADEVQTGSVTIDIFAQDSDDAATFTTTTNDVSNVALRPKTTATTSWSPSDWNTIGEAGTAQKTADIGPLIQEVINRGGWASGNDIVIVFTGSGTNKRTAETDPTLFIDFAGTTGNTWGCATNTPHQNFDGDAEDDWRDVDDDNDGILTSNEGADLDGNGQPDYLEIAPCPQGQTQQSSVGNGDVVTSENLITNSGNSTGASNGTMAVFADDTDSELILDLTDELSSGSIVTVTWGKFNGNGTARLRVEYGTDGVNFTSIGNISTSSASTTTNVTLPGNARYLRFESRRREPQLDAVAYSATTCVDDKDMDGIPDNIDEDDDNDGISDIVEGSGSNLDTDGDGIPDACDLDSDNDGIPDAVEANGGTLPANMLASGQYSVAFIVDPTNDTNSNGWYETGEGGTTYANNVTAPIDTDSDLIPDYIDLDADNDCVPDATEANNGDLPANMNTSGQFTVAYATTNDADGDGYIDDVDGDKGGTALLNPDTDGDGDENYIDTDADGDGLDDSLEAHDPDPVLGGTYTDGLDNGCPAPNMPDADCNGIVDYLDAGKLSAGSGNFTVSSIWTDGIVPTAGKTITVLNSHVVTLTGNVTVGSVNINNGGEINLNGFNLTILGNLDVTGTLTASNGTVLFNGTCPQEICGDVTFDNLTIDNTSGVDVACGCIEIAGTLDLEDGELDVCDATCFTLLSNASNGETAGIDATGNGTITCDVERERYKEGCADGFITMATPYSTNPPADWGDDLLITGLPGGPNSTFWTSLYEYDEAVITSFTDGYVPPTHYTTDILKRGKGYYMYGGLADLPAKISVSGTVDLEPFAFPITYTSSGISAEDGYNLLGNPYPAAIDWEIDAGWTKVGCCDAIWVWNECNDQFASYSGGSATNGGQQVVEPSQGFWVKAHVPGASITVNRGAITTANGDFRSTGVLEEIKIHINGFSADDEMVLRLDDDANHGHDDEADAVNMLSSETMMALYSIDNDGMDCSINAFPHDGTSKTTPLMVRVPQNGDYVLDFTGAQDYPADMCLMFRDNESGDIYDLRSMTTYDFTMNSMSNPENRFDIIMSYAPAVEIADVTCKGANDGTAEFVASGVGPYNLIWKDNLGNVVATSNGVAGNTTIADLNDGVYSLEVEDLGAVLCTVHEVAFTVESPIGTLSISDLITNEDCAGALGNINTSTYGGTGPFTYLWSNGVTTQDLVAAAGTYTLLATDVNGCAETMTATILPSMGVSAGFEVDDITVNLATGQAAIFANNSTNATNYRWDFGDSTMSNQSNPQHFYQEVGEYEVTLYASNGPCIETTSLMVTVVNAVGLEDNEELMFNVFQSNNKLNIKFISDVENDGIVRVIASNGGLVVSETAMSGTSNLIIDIANFSIGAYTVVFESRDSMSSKKIVIN